MRLLIVDDEREFREILARALASPRVEVVSAANAAEARAAIASRPRGHFDLLVLDVSMPGLSGPEFLEQLRREGLGLPVVFVTARGAIEEKVAALAAGADDWLVKPFALAELSARIEAVLRRRADALIEYGDVRVDLGRQRVFRQGQPVDLSPRELELLLLLLRRKGGLVARDELLREIWELDFDPGTNVIDVQLGRLRRKLDRLGPPCIESVRGQGYRLVAEASSA